MCEIHSPRASCHHNTRRRGRRVLPRLEARGPCISHIRASHDLTRLLDKNMTKLHTTLPMWQSSRPASFWPAGLILWPNLLERWLVTLSGHPTQFRIPVGLSLPERYIGVSSAGLGKAQCIDSSLRADWLPCFSLAWWVGGLPEWDVWCHRGWRNVTIQPAY